MSKRIQHAIRPNPCQERGLPGQQENGEGGHGSEPYDSIGLQFFGLLLAEVAEGAPQRLRGMQDFQVDRTALTHPNVGAASCSILLCLDRAEHQFPARPSLEDTSHEDIRGLLGDPTPQNHELRTRPCWDHDTDLAHKDCCGQSLMVNPTPIHGAAKKNMLHQSTLKPIYDCYADEQLGTQHH